MKTIKCDPSNGLGPDCEEAIQAAVEDLKAGKLIVFPTDTVYGIGANIYNEIALKNLYKAKKRPYDMPLSVAVYDMAQLKSVANLCGKAEKLVDAFLPGPLTMIVPKKENVPDLLTSSSKKVGIRIPDNPIAREICRRFGPIVATSANIHSKPDALSAQDAIEDFGEQVSTYIDAGSSLSGKPSTIVWLTRDEFEIIREGAISADQIEEALGC